MPKPRVSTLLLVGALLVAILAAANLFVIKNDLQTQLTVLTEQNKKLTVAKKALEDEKGELTKAKDELESKLTTSEGKAKDLETQARELADQLEQEKRARLALSNEVSQAQSEASSWRAKGEVAEREKKSLADDLTKAKQSYQALSNELTTLREAKAALEKRVKEMLATQSNEAEKIVVRPTPGTAPAPKPMGLEGKVLVVNREFGFIVINLGSKDGVKDGTTISIWREGKRIGTAQAEKIYENMAAVTILAEEEREKIVEGDSVRTS